MARAVAYLEPQLFGPLQAGRAIVGTHIYIGPAREEFDDEAESA
jgi:hypothetical protein